MSAQPPPPGHWPPPGQGPPPAHRPPPAQPGYGPPGYPGPSPGSPFGPPWIPPARSYAHEARDPRRLARVTQWSFLPVVLVMAATLLFQIWYLVDLLGAAEGNFYSSDALLDGRSRVDAISGFEALTFLPPTVLFTWWSFRVARNARALGAADPRLDPGWAIGGWFIPFANYVIPLLVLNDAWRGSDPDLPEQARRDQWQSRPVPWLFLAWWLVWILAIAAYIAGGELYINGESVDEDTVAMAISALGSVATIAAAVMAVRVVELITKRQVKRAEKRERSGPPIPTGPPPPPPPPPPPLRNRV